MSDNNMMVFKDLQRSQCSESGKHKLLEDGFDQSFEVSASKRARVSPFFVNLQNADFAGLMGSSLLGLKLEISYSFLDLFRSKLCEGKQVDFSSHQNQGSYLNERPKTKFDASRSSQQKLKASNITAVLLKIGSWQKQSIHEGCLAAKIYYAKRRMVWEVLEGGLKNKIEIEWSDITAIRASMADTDGPGILEIQLNKQPLFFRETNPQPRKHTSWAPVPDFTGGQATLIRRHLMVFPPGVLDRHYEQLLKCDKRLSALSHIPFPIQESPFFGSNRSGLPRHSLSPDGRESGFESMFIRPSPNSAAPAAMNYPTQSADNGPTAGDQGIDNLPEGNVGIQEPVRAMNQWQVDVNAGTQGHQPLISYQDYRPNLTELHDSENNLLWNNIQVPCTNEGNVGAEVEAYLDPNSVHLHKNNLIINGMRYYGL